MKKLIALLVLLVVVTTNGQFLITAGGGNDAVPSLWKRPTGDTDDAWTNSANAYDNDLGTFANCSTSGQAVTFTIGALTCSKIRIYAGRVAGGQADLIIDVYYGGEFHNIQDGVLTEDVWVEIAIGSSQSVTAARITTGDSINSAVHEINFYDAS
jgi:hypothetical protein